MGEQLKTIQNQTIRKIKSHPHVILTILIGCIPAFYFLFSLSDRIFSYEPAQEDRLINVYDDGVWYQVLGSSTENNSRTYSVKNLVIFVDGEEKRIETKAVELSEVFFENSILIGEYDIVDPHLLAPVSDGMQVKITRVNKIQEVQERPIPILTEYRDNDEMYLGQEVVVQEGQEGKREVIVEKTFQDGELFSEEVIADKVIQESEVRIIERGTKVVVLDTQYGKATWYVHPRYVGEMITAHNTYERGSMLRVTNLSNNKSVVVQVVDNGIHREDVKVDLSKSAFSQIASPYIDGIVSVKVELLQN